MSEQILRTWTTEVTKKLEVRRHAGEGFRIVFKGEQPICGESSSDVAREAGFLRQLREAGRHDGSVAIVGAGLSILAWLLGPAYKITQFEMEPELEQFAPSWSRWVSGDWQSTLDGTFDIIVYDIGDRPPEGRLEQHLVPGGLLLGVD